MSNYVLEVDYPTFRKNVREKVELLLGEPDDVSPDDEETTLYYDLDERGNEMKVANLPHINITLMELGTLKQPFIEKFSKDNYTQEDEDALEIEEG